MDEKNIIKMINEVKTGSVLIIGDIILDCYVQGVQERFSSEAPISIFDMKSIFFCLGGAGNVALNLLNAKQKVTLCSVVGNDYFGDKILNLLKKYNLDDVAIITESGRKTTTKIRFKSENDTQVFRSDYEDRYDISIDTKYCLISFLRNNINNYDIILLSDYQKGCLTSETIKTIVKIAHDANIPVWVDSKNSNARIFRGCDLIKPNRTEFLKMVKLTNNCFDIQIVETAKKLCRDNDNHYIVVTLGSRGMVFVENTQVAKIIPALKVLCHDVSGAGDTAFSYLAVGKLSGFSMLESVKLANIAAGISVEKFGAAPISLYDIKFRLCKHIEWKDVPLLTNYLKNKKVVFTNGCFDIIHSGHVHSLRQAKELGDILIIGINSDESIQRLKGKNRPINGIEERISVLESFEFVDYIIPFGDNTPLELIQLLHPDILVKGRDYIDKKVVGEEFVCSYGGSVILVDYLEGYSTTKTIEQIRSLENL